MEESHSDQPRLRFFRVPVDLKPYVPILGTGLGLLLSSWEFPEVPAAGVKLTRVWLTPAMEAQIDYLAKNSRNSATRIVVAALTRARHSKVRPPRRPGVMAAE
jgi:hypothetical protein